MHQVQYADGQTLIRDKEKSVIDTALAQSLADKPGHRRTNVIDDNNFTVVDGSGKALFYVSGPRVQSTPAPEPNDGDNGPGPDA